MSQSRTLFLGMDVHTDAMAVAYVAQEHGAEGMYLGTLGTRQGAREQRLRTRPSKAQHVVLVYEAGPCGDWLSRSLSQKGDDCWVVAPSWIPNKPGERVQTDRRDAMPLARRARSGALPVVSVPQVEEEAIRELTRARADTRSDGKAAPVRLTACFLRHALRSTGRANGRPAPLRWLSEVLWPTPAQHIVLPAEVGAVNEHPARLARLAQERPAPVNAWRVPPVVAALQARRGGPCPVAITLVAERGALPRFDHPSALLKLLGLIPAASSAGARRQQGAMTTAGGRPRGGGVSAPENCWPEANMPPGSRGPLPVSWQASCGPLPK